jgi:hypothetical protein
MRKFPELIATKQDVENIINDHPEYHAQLKVALLRALNEPDKTLQVISYDTDEEIGEMINIVEKQITRPNQMWKRMGYKNRGELDSALALLVV